MTSADHQRRGDADPDGAPSAPVAIALAHDPAAHRAPRVVAAGRGAVAERILALAFALGIRVREDADLAELLAAVDVDSEIPAAAFAAVAEILVYVYRANGTMPTFDAAALDAGVATS
jgi:flagellar biosynthesis protein